MCDNTLTPHLPWGLAAYFVPKILSPASPRPGMM